MVKWLAPAVALSAFLAGAVHAACPTPPYTLSNGSTADASQLMANFNNVATCFAPLASPSFTGNVGIGTTTPSGYLDVYGGPTNLQNDTASADQLYILGKTNPNQRLIIGYNTVSNYGSIQSLLNGTSPEPLILQSAGGSVGIGTISPTSGYTLTVSGSAIASGGTWVNSDARLKEHVQTVTDGLALVEQLRPVRYDWRSPETRSVGKDLKLASGKPQIGFIAQEVEKIVPEAVKAPGKSASETYAMNEAALIPVLAAAIKEQQVEIEQLRAEVAALKAAH